MKTAFAMKLLEGIAHWPVTTACDSALQAPFNRQARLPALRAVRHLALMPACIGSISSLGGMVSLSGMAGLRGAAGMTAMAAGSTVDGGRLARRAR